ncbi:early nodule-specific protein 2 isoform X1 [Ziziphus jujuba]|uniref:Early nodule-specific protein 2 isoform X1 n=2 Tax=Ziziphus jujuba TaxID=326968 RepID=A0A6P4BLG8_ZIZJJ|nr:early nodule-specific protein 2 isoform X1 [Ziziphus jujuba]KAH7513413.1 hypothetical protein FEM48_Zijuj12G0197300 [Ziziphus jujuba var. spinosa]
MPPIDSPFMLSILLITKLPHTPGLLSFPLLLFFMVPELEKPKITEIQVRMDCNGCVQKIKKALYGINGIYDLYIDFPQQKLTVIGWAEPERIMKAIKKTRKVATICSHTEVAEPAAPPPTEQQQPQEGTSAQPPPAPDEAPSNPPSSEAPPPPPAEASPPAEQPKDPPPPENPPPEPTQPTPSPPVTVDTNAGQPGQPSRPKEVGEVHVVYHHPPPEYGYRYGYGHGGPGYWNKYQSGQEPHEPAPVPAPAPVPVPPVYVTHSYNTYRPSSHVTEYEYVRSPPRQPNYTRIDPYYSRIDPYYNRNDHYHEEQQYYVNGNNGSGNITSIFSDENPNACRIV